MNVTVLNVPTDWHSLLTQVENAKLKITYERKSNWYEKEAF